MKAENKRLQTQLKKVNSESAQRRIELKELKEEKQKRDEAEMSDLEKAQTRADDLENENQILLMRLREHDLRRSFTVTAEKMDVQFSSSQAVDDAFALAQPLLAEVEIDEEGNVESRVIKTVIKEVLEGREYLTAKGSKAPNIDADKRGTESLETPSEEIRKAKAKQQDYSSF